MKKYQLTLIVHNDNSSLEPTSLDKVESDNLTELLAQFQFVLIRIIRKEEQAKVDDDIPF